MPYLRLEELFWFDDHHSGQYNATDELVSQPGLETTLCHDQGEDWSEGKGDGVFPLLGICHDVYRLPIRFPQIISLRNDRK